MSNNLTSVSKNLTALCLGLEVNWLYSNPYIEPNIHNINPQQECLNVVSINGIIFLYDDRRTSYNEK